MAQPAAQPLSRATYGLSAEMFDDSCGLLSEFICFIDITSQVRVFRSPADTAGDFPDAFNSTMRGRVAGTPERLDLFQSASFRFGNEVEGENPGRNGQQAVEPEGSSGSHEL
jgi:hypothetical protein